MSSSQAGRGTSETGGAQSIPALTLPDRPSIAVLPFANMSGDPGQDYFADGMTEEVITALSRCTWLFVIARNSSFTYKGKTVDVRQVGRELGVRYVLEGSIRRAGGRVRFTGQLIDASSGGHIWADRFEGEMSDVFDLQDRFTESVVAAIEPKLQIAEIERLKQKPAASLDAYDLLLRAQQLESSAPRKASPRRSHTSKMRLQSILPTPQRWLWLPIATQAAASRVGRTTSKPTRKKAFVLHCER